ncbi:unnamed protein product, partial [marine sediment metagenome]
MLYAFEPLESSTADDKTRTLKKIWQCDCNPSDYRRQDGRDIPYATFR